jgi:hypothetical protein
VDLSTTASLIVATFDLAVVRSIRDAIRTADISAGRGQPASGLGPAPNPEPQRRIHFQPETVYEPRRHVHPTPKVEERLICYKVRYRPCLEPLPDLVAQNLVEPVVAAVQPSCPIERPLPPVWAQLPPIPIKPHTPPRRVIKMMAARSDIQMKGLVLDVHI